MCGAGSYSSYSSLTADNTFEVAECLMIEQQRADKNHRLLALFCAFSQRPEGSKDVTKLFLDVGII